MSPFTIKISDNSVEVWSPATKPRLRATLWTILLSWGLAAYVLVMISPLLGSLLSDTRDFDLWNWLLALALLYVGVVLLWQGFRALFPAGESLTCDKDTLTISRIPGYVLDGRWTSKSFPSKEIKQLAWGVVHWSRYGGTTGLIFYVDGKKKKILNGLEAPEAEQVLQGLTTLGIDTVHDPAMPMIIEMAMSRRKSRFGLF